MIEAGDIYLADLSDERHRVLVMSVSRFNEAAARAIVAPELRTEPGDVLFPWHITAGEVVFAVDLLRSLPAERLLERLDRASPAVMDVARRAVRNIIT